MTADLTAEVIAATERADDLLALWRELRRIDHRARLARLRFELVDAFDETVGDVAAELAEFRLLVRAFFGRAE